MFPTGIAAFVALGALIPAWYYKRRTESVRPPGTRSSLAEVLEYLAVAALTTGPPAIVVAAWAPTWWTTRIFDPAEWLRNGTPYLADHLRGAAIELVLILAVAILLAEGLAFLVRRGVPDEFHPTGAVWTRALAERPVGTYPWAGVSLQDGTLVEGVLSTIDLGSTGDDRDLALAAPIRVTPADSTAAEQQPHLHRVVIPAREIRWISAMHLPEDMTPRLPKQTRLTYMTHSQTGIWRDVASNVVSSLITAYVIFAVAGFIGIAALGGPGTPLRWLESIVFLGLSLVLAGAGAHLAWTVSLVFTRYHHSHLRLLDTTSTWRWIISGTSSIGALVVTASFINNPSAMVIAALIPLLLIVNVWATKKEVRSKGWVFVVWVVVNLGGALIGVGGMGLVIGSILRRAIAADLG